MLELLRYDWEVKYAKCRLWSQMLRSLRNCTTHLAVVLAMNGEIIRGKLLTKEIDKIWDNKFEGF